MLEISGKKVEVNDESKLASRFAVFIVECDYDCRTYVGHTVGLSAKAEIRKFVNSALDESVKCNVLLKESMKNSQKLYVTIKEPEEYTLDALFKMKYRFILSCGSYEPYGFNKICKIGNKSAEEKRCIDQLRAEIGPLYKRVATASHVRAIKEYAYKGGYREIAEWPSIIAAARYYNVNASNIAACCSGRLSTAYGRVWKYAD